MTSRPRYTSHEPVTPTGTRPRQTTQEHSLDTGEVDLGVGLLTLTIDGRVLEADRTVVQLFGLQACATVGRAITDLLTFAEPARLTQHLAACVRGRGPLVTELRCRVGGVGHVFEWLSVPMLVGDEWVTSSAVRDRSASARREAGLALLAELSDAPAGASEPHALAVALARVLAPAFADVCLIYWDLLDGGDATPPLPLAIASAQPSPPDRDQLLAGVATDVHATLQSGVGRRTHAGLYHGAIVPLAASERTLGALVMLEAGPGREGSATWRALAGEVARRVERALLAASQHAALAHALAGRDELVAMLAHDLRNTIGTISTNCQLLERQEQHQPESWSARTRRLNGIHRATRWMDELVEDLLDKRALERGQPGVAPESLDAAELCREAIALHEVRAELRGIHLVVEELVPASVRTDHGRAMQVLDNLIANALAASPDGEAVHLRVDRHGSGQVRFAVEDAGPGLELRGTDVEQVFRTSLRQHRAGDAHGRGRGLGLPIAQTLVRQLGGRLWVERAESGGSVFCFTLPAAEAAGPGSIAEPCPGA